jgi:hypothetical protein
MIPYSADFIFEPPVLQDCTHKIVFHNLHSFLKTRSELHPMYTGFSSLFISSMKIYKKINFFLWFHVEQVFLFHITWLHPKHHTFKTISSGFLSQDHHQQ